MKNQNPTDPLIQQLRNEAASFDPALPPDLHRKIISTLAQADARPRAKSRLLHWLIPAATMTAAAIVTILLFQNHPTPTQPSHQTPVVIKTPNPITLTMQYVDDPLQTEVQSLVNDFTRASTTVTHVFPGASKRQPKPATQGPAGV